MGLTYIPAKVSRPDGRGRPVNVRFLVDTGAIYTVLPENIWRTLKLKPQRAVEFTLADGTTMTRQVSECRFTLEGQSATSPVVLGEAADAPLLGAVTLETLGFMINPLSRELLPMRMILARVGSPRKGGSGRGLSPSLAPLTGSSPPFPPPRGPHADSRQLRRSVSLPRRFAPLFA
jgi:clan AA aspartic protease